MVCHMFCFIWRKCNVLPKAVSGCQADQGVMQLKPLLVTAVVQAWDKKVWDDRKRECEADPRADFVSHRP